MKKIALMLSIILSVFFLNVNATENNFSVEYAQFGYRLDVTGDIKKAVNLSVFKDIPAELADATENGELTIEKILLSGGQPVAIKQFEKIGYHTLSVPVSQELSDGSDP